MYDELYACVNLSTLHRKQMLTFDFWQCASIGANLIKLLQPFSNEARVVDLPQIGAQNNPITMLFRKTSGHNNNALTGAKRRLVIMIWKKKTENIKYYHVSFVFCCVLKDLC